MRFCLWVLMVSAAIVRDDSKALDGDPIITAGREKWEMKFKRDPNSGFLHTYFSEVKGLLQSSIFEQIKTRDQGDPDNFPNMEKQRIAREQAEELATYLFHAFVHDGETLYPKGVSERVIQVALKELKTEIGNRLDGRNGHRAESSPAIKAIHQGWIATIAKFIKQ